MESKDKLKIAGGVAVALLAGSIVLNVRNKSMDRKAGVFFSELERKISPESAGLTESDAFDIHYWKKVGDKLKKSYYLLQQKTADSFAKTISSAWGVFDDDEDKINGVFRALKDQVAVSQVSSRYYIHNKVNLVDELRSRLSKEEVAAIMKIVSKLPPYRLVTTDNK